MFAKQTLTSASLVVVLGGSAVSALADPDPDPPKPADGEATGKFQIGAGFSSDEGFVATAAIVQPYLFRTDNELGLTATISEREELFVTHFASRHLLGSELRLGGDLYSDRKLLPGFTRTAIGGTITASAPLTAHVRGFIGYRLEQVTGERDAAEAAARGLPIGPEPPLSAGLVSAVRAGIEYSTLDTRYLPTRGTNLGFELEYADPRLGSAIQLARAHAWASTHQPLGPLTLHVGGSASVLSSPNAIPLTERLFLDGSRDIRGYGPGAWSPLGADGRQIGGDMKLTGRASLELPIYAGVSVEGFADYARITAVGAAATSGATTGFGIIWRSPIGPLHFDWAFPIGGGGPTFVFGMGGAF